MIHVDGYDKLSPFNFYIHGAMDGFSRKVLWLKVGHTNKKPEVVGHFFLQYLEEIEGIPRCVRMDPGSENTLISDLQNLLFRNSLENSPRPPVLFGFSVHNQRIERFWRFLFKNFTVSWLNFFTGMFEIGLFSPTNILHQELLQFCFMDLLQNELNFIRHRWNSHRVRKMASVNCPSGIPDLLFSCPELKGGQDHKISISLDKITNAAEIIRFEDQHTFGPLDDFSELMLNIMFQTGYPHFPKNANDCLNLYGFLLSYIRVCVV